MHGNTRRASKAVISFVAWFRDTYAPSVAAVSITIALLTAMRAASKSSVCGLFRRAFLEPYGAAARSRDETFFLTMPVPSAAPAAISGMTAEVRSVWLLLAPEHKLKVWGRLDALMDLFEHDSTAPTT